MTELSKTAQVTQCDKNYDNSIEVRKEFENLWNGKERKPRFFDGDKNYDNSIEVRKAFENLWGKFY